MAAAGYRVRHITDPGTLDGGDVLKVGSTVYVGLTGRTNAAAADQLAAFLGPLGATVVPVPTTKVLHLKSAVTALPDGRVIGYPPLVDDPAAFGEFVAVPEEAGAHVVLLGPDRDGAERLLMAAGAPRTAARFTELGYRPVLVDISRVREARGLRDLPVGAVAPAGPLIGRVSRCGRPARWRSPGRPARRPGRAAAPRPARPR